MKKKSCDCWDAIENKTMVVIYVGGAVVGVWLASTVIDAINGLPVVPKFMELVGLRYTGWFIYRYLLFKVNLHL
ncbi:cyanobacterial aminoacyl-tRNA synthetase, CAAD domain-containing protein [Artemisia annua]|uniref:Cyanobacterial aminoacyl-tRNA synthetase, CAAD domain-containing protein n=1 Tax=Artemisia annua TaxID=35608 RepID=A0A2U1PGG4_ARTAN|nr:cyanobacterial aminoacyl-tRNA synthetase, CAAD domain-containing protein [Artemisia annua]